MTEQQEKAFKQLVEFSKDLENVNYEEIKNIISKSIRQVPIATAFLRKGWFVDRVRVNKGNQLFTNENEISYIKDQYVIDNYLTQFGRANKPHQVMFYGAVKSSEIWQPRATAIFETSQILKDKEAVNIEGELLTVSRWKVLEDILLVEIVFDDDAIAKNPNTRAAFNHHMKQIAHHPLRELGLRQIQFFSREFAKKVENHWEYKISVAYTELILHDKKPSINGYPIEGIAYPSVPSDHKGQNVVLRPDVVDAKLELELVSTHIVHKNQLKSFVNNHKYVTDFGQDNSSFTWVDMATEHVISLEDVKRNHLGIKE
ncbi:MAG: hypothetical protein IPK21_22025 [Haliscomenobacter sp.]|nr:hypothetical protein [Haliscomenobacter sp.]